MRAQFTRAALTPAPTTQGHRWQGLVYTYGEEMTLKAAEAIKMVLDEGTACMANRTYHVHPHTGDTWQYAFPGDDGMESIAPLPECARQGAEISALARVAEEWVRETGGVQHENWALGAIRRARYRRGEWMTREDTEAIFPVATKGPAAAKWRGQGVHIILPDDKVGSRGMVEVEVRHGQGARYQYDVLLPNVVVTAAAAAGMEVRIGLGREGQAVQVYTMGHWEGQPGIQWMAEPTWREQLHPEGQVGRGKADGADAAELDRAEKEKEKRQKEAAAEGLDMLGDGRDRKDMLQKWAQRLRGKATASQNVLIENGEAQPGLEDRIKGCRGEEVRQAVSKARYHLKARAEAVEDKCRPECTLARCLCRLEGPQEPKGGYHGIRVWQPRRQGPMWLQMRERGRDAAGVLPPSQAHVGGICGWSEQNSGGGGGGGREASKGADPHGKEGGAKTGGAVDADAAGCACSGVCGQHEQNGGGVGAQEAGLGHGAVRWGDSALQQRHGQGVGPRHRNAPDAQGYDHGRL